MIVVNNRKELKKLISQRIKTLGPNCDLNDIDVSKIDDMSFLFHYSPFNGDISAWDVSRVKNMRAMFQFSNFNGDISNWNVSKVKDMRGMFFGSNFNGDLSRWDVSKVKIMTSIFHESPLHGKEPDWYEVSLRLTPLRGLDSNSSFKAHNRACKLRNISSNIIHHPRGRSELRDALTCEIGFLRRES